MSEKIRILLVDDHQLILDGLLSILSSKEDIDVVALANNGKEAVEKYATFQPDIVLMDVDMPVMNGVVASKMLLEKDENINIIMLTMHLEKALVTSLVNLGIKGYLLKNSTRDELYNSIIKVKNGDFAFSDEVALALIDKKQSESKFVNEALSKEQSLTRREVEILKLIAEGFSNTEIGDKLFISARTVDTHRTNMMKKLNIKNIAGLIKFAFQVGLIE